MSKTLDVTSERVDDIPLLLAQLEWMGVQELLDKHFVTHGNWKSLSLGWCSVVWLSYILSQADHRLSYVEDWANKRFKGFPLSLTPIYLQREDHIKGLIRLLSIALRVLTLLEFQVRRHLADKKQKLSGLYAGNPKRTTNRPTAEQLLSVFKEINRVTVAIDSQVDSQIEQLSPLQQEILTLLEIPVEIYTQLKGKFNLVS